MAKRYPIGYARHVLTTSLVLRARRTAGLSQRELALRAGTSRPTLSAYEHGRKSPSLATAGRILAAAGFDLDLTPRIVFTEHAVGRGRTISVASRLPRLDADVAFAAVELPLHLNWSDRGRIFDLRNRRQRARVYEIVLREGRPEDLLAYVDGLLLMDLWDELVLPVEVRAAWSPVVAEAVRAVA